MNNTQIENRARGIQIEIWNHRSSLWLGRTPSLIEMLRPEVAAHVLGIKFEYCEELGRFGSGHDRFETAGMIDRQARKIAVSRRFPSEVMRFTGAHEVGHWELHSDAVMHRDRPIKGIYLDGSVRPSHEREADYFAACFLVPGKMLTKSFKKRFREKPLILDDTVAFWLNPSDPDSLLRADIGSLDFALAVASASSYGGAHFMSLASQFGVSPTTMAIRLLELELIEE